MFKQPLCYVTAKTPMLKALSPEGLSDKAITQLLAKTQAQQYISNDKIRSTLLNMLVLAKRHAVDPIYHKNKLMTKYQKYPQWLYGVMNHKLNSLNDPKFKDLIDLALKGEKKDLLFIDAAPEPITNPIQMRVFKEALIKRMPKYYDLTKEIDSIIGDASKYDEKAVREFLESLKLSKTMTPNKLAAFIKERYLTPYNVIEKEQSEINISGEEEIKIVKEYKYANTVDANNINEDIFANENIFELMIAYTTFAPIEHLEVLSMHMQENITATFLNEKKIAVLTSLLKRLSLEKALISSVVPVASKINRKNDLRFEGSKNIISSNTFFEIARDEKLCEKFRIQLITNILHNPDLGVNVVQGYFKENQVLTKTDLVHLKDIIRARFPDMVQNPEKYVRDKQLDMFAKADDVQIITHNDIVAQIREAEALKQ